MDSTSQSIFEKLRVWRNQEAISQMTEPYMIFQNKVLQSIANEKPKTLEELASIKGLGQKKLMQIKTYSQTFSDNPNEKFLLMILCSQAKLENDQKGINVKRGIRAKCEMGWRPGIAPLGYMNRAFGGKRISLSIRMIDLR
ncbi:hypothetical protein FJY90_05765 [Candidatus Gottesmanbacteria bacterium]|nr:hypothetical protein [Candidatus Gottesmanbacteria bacterium]